MSEKKSKKSINEEKEPEFDGFCLVSFEIIPLYDYFFLHKQQFLSSPFVPKEVKEKLKTVEYEDFSLEEYYPSVFPFYVSKIKKNLNKVNYMILDVGYTDRLKENHFNDTDVYEKILGTFENFDFSFRKLRKLTKTEKTQVDELTKTFNFKQGHFVYPQKNNDGNGIIVKVTKKSIFSIYEKIMKILTDNPHCACLGDPYYVHIVSCGLGQIFVAKFDTESG